MKTFWVDIPDPDAGDEGEWLNVASFDQRQQAETYLSQRWGIPSEHCSVFITEGTEEE